jgi:putative nucleotidyltransferase with HDIG domain
LKVSEEAAMSASSEQNDRTLVTLNHISEMIAGRSPLPEIFGALAAGMEEASGARWGLFVHLAPPRPAEFYGSGDALLFGPALLQSLQQARPVDGSLAPLLLTIHAPPEPNLLVAVTMPTFHGRTLRGALAALYEHLPRKIPTALLILLNNQARIAIEKWRLDSIVSETYTGVIQALASLIDTRDPYAHRHSRAVTELAVALAETLGLAEEDVNTIRYAAILHDIGKIGISEAILTKPGPLIPSERAVVEAHPLLGVSILRNVPYMDDVARLIRHHHEHYDGSGYPDGLRGDEIPLGAQIIAIADAFEALTTGERSYHRGRSIPEACTILRQEAGRAFNSELVAAFLRMIGEPVDNP